MPPSTVAGQAFPAGLEEIVLACLDKSPDKRPASAVDLWRRLGDIALPAQWSIERAELWWREQLPQFAGSFRADSSGDIKIDQSSRSS